MRFIKEDKFDKDNTKRVNKNHMNPYKNCFAEAIDDSKDIEHYPREEPAALREVSNQYFPKIEDILHSKEGRVEQKGTMG